MNNLEILNRLLISLIIAILVSFFVTYFLGTSMEYFTIYVIAGVIGFNWNKIKTWQR